MFVCEYSNVTIFMVCFIAGGYEMLTVVWKKYICMHIIIFECFWTYETSLRLALRSADFTIYEFNNIFVEFYNVIL